MTMTNETRLTTIKKRRRRQKAVVVLYQDEGMLYQDDKLDQMVDQKALDDFMADDNITLVIIAYENIDLSMPVVGKEGLPC